jgi:hypothetical protein
MDKADPLEQTRGETPQLILSQVHGLPRFARTLESTTLFCFIFSISLYYMLLISSLHSHEPTSFFTLVEKVGAQNADVTAGLGGRCIQLETPADHAWLLPSLELIKNNTKAALLSFLHRALVHVP